MLKDTLYEILGGIIDDYSEYPEEKKIIIKLDDLIDSNARYYLENLDYETLDIETIEEEGYPCDCCGYHYEYDLVTITGVDI